jgi:hypothetical protein
MREARFKVRLGITAVAAVLALSAAPAGAVVTIGKAVDPGLVECDFGTDITQTIPSAGSSFVIPGAGTITSWTTHAGPNAGHMISMKVFRKIAESLRYQVVGHAGPQTLTPGGTAGNTFPANVRVAPGDLLGLHTVTDNSGCLRPTPGPQIAYFQFGDLADGASEVFTLQNDIALNIQATFVPDNTFTRAKTKRNKNKGTATVTLNLPNPGVLTGSGGGAKVAGGAVMSKAVTAGRAKIVIRAKGKKKRTLNETGKVKVRPKITYTPTGGEPGTQKLKLKLLKR